MSDERPVSLKVRKKSNTSSCNVLPERMCIIHYDRNKNDTEVKALSEQAFEKIQACVAIRLKQDHTSVHRLESICSKVPNVLDPNCHGFHRWCYQNFTNTTRLVCDAGDNAVMRSSKRQRLMSPSSSSDLSSSSTIFPRYCLFCGAVNKSVKGKVQNLRVCQTEDAQESIKRAAVEKGDFDLLGKISDCDLIAKEAVFHESCRRNYITRTGRQHHRPSLQNTEDLEEAAAYRSSHKEAFDHVCQYVMDEVVNEGRVIRMTMAHEKYQLYLLQNSPTHYNENYQTHKLKEKLVRHFGDKIQFWNPNGRSDLLYSSKIPTGSAVQVAFEAATSETRQLEEAALVLHRHIRQAQLAAPDIPWPPSAEDLLSSTVCAPIPLTNFLSVVVTGKKSNSISEKNSRLVNSIAADICSAATRSQWRLPKQILLGMSVRHLTGSAQLITLLNRFGHCMAYPQLLELETAMALHVQLSDDILPSNICQSNNKMVHTCWDNFDLLEETASGAGTTHSTHGIVIQEIVPDVAANRNYSAKIPKSRLRTIQPVDVELSPCFAKSQPEPVLSLPDGLTSTTCIEVEDRNISLQRLIWTLCRAEGNHNYTVPQWSGWISVTASSACEPQQLSVIGFLPPIQHPITDKATVQHCLYESMKISRRLNQEYTFVTMDLAAAKLAYHVVWDSPHKFPNVFVQLGAFHTACSYMGALGKFVAGSGFEDIIIEGGICASGSINKVMSGKHYNRALRVHQVMLDTLERLLLKSFLHDQPLSSAFPDIFSSVEHLTNNLDFQSLSDVTNDPTFRTFAASYDKYRDDIRNGKHGKTAQYWMMYIDNVWNLLHFLRAVKENDLDLYISAIRQLLPLLFAADHVHYARYLSVFYVQLKVLPSSHPAAVEMLKDNGFTVARSTIPANRTATDMTMEQTLNRSAKTAGGIIGFSMNKGAYYRWCITRHIKSSYWEATQELADMTDPDIMTNRAIVQSVIKKNEEDVQRLLGVFDDFQNPFSGESDQLVCISSGQPATVAVEKDLLQFNENGRQAADLFLHERLLSNNVQFHDTLKRQNLKTFQSMAVKKSLTTSQRKTIEIKADRNLLGRLLVLCQSNDLDLPKLFTFQLGPIPWALSTADGHMTKSSKAQLMHVLERDLTTECEKPHTDQCIHIIDGNALLQSLTNLPDTFGQLAKQVFRCLPRSPIVHFVTDSYKTGSIKQLERDRRGRTVMFNIGGPLTKLPADFKSFMLNSENKRQLIHHLISEWKSTEYAADLQDRKLYFVDEEHCYLLQSSDGITVTVCDVPDLKSDHEEADTRIILHCLNTSYNTSDSTIIVRSPDTDVFILLLYYTSQVHIPLLFDTGVGNKRRLIDIQSLATAIGPTVCSALPGFHAFTGCDYTSSFVRRGKVRPLQLLRDSEKFSSCFQQLGNTPTLDLDLSPILEEFVCNMYGKSSCTDVNQLRYELFLSRYDVKSDKSFTIPSGIDASLLPPCRSSLIMHTRRANYVAHIWRNAHVSHLNIPSPNGYGWVTCTDGSLDIQWNDVEVLPEKLLDILESKDTTDDAELEEDSEVDNIIDVVFDD